MFEHSSVSFATLTKDSLTSSGSKSSFPNTQIQIPFSMNKDPCFTNLANYSFARFMRVSTSFFSLFKLSLDKANTLTSFIPTRLHHSTASIILSSPCLWPKCFSVLSTSFAYLQFPSIMNAIFLGTWPPFLKILGKGL